MQTLTHPPVAVSSPNPTPRCRLCLPPLSARSLTLNVRKMFQEIDSQLYERCRQQCEEVEQQQEAEQHRRRQQWEAVEQAARQAGGGGNGMLPRR
jgi:serine/threonine-protein phosphatase 2A regulatory subunit B'